VIQFGCVAKIGEKEKRLGDLLRKKAYAATPKAW
jgi:hypothetical protein